MNRRWIRVAASVEEIPFNDAGLAEIEAGGRRICMGWHGSVLYAFAPKCPHASGRLAEGYIDPQGNVVCPVHRYKFCMKNGHNISGEGFYLRHWPVESREDGIYVGLDRLNIFGF